MKLFDATLTRLERSLDVRLARHNILASNVANVDTPGFRPKDVDFNAAMATATSGENPGGDASIGLTTTDPAHLGVGGGGIGGGGDMPLLESNGQAPSFDGNRVDLDRTMVEMARNGMQYGAAARAAGRKLAILRYVITEGSG
jgi:flagellar basal-body rod protein FlgB